MTHKVLELFDHPCKSFCSNADIILVKTRSLVNNSGLAVSYLNDVDVRKTPGLDSGVNEVSNRGMRVHIQYPHEREIPPPTYPRREQDRQTLRRNHRQSSRCVSS